MDDHTGNRIVEALNGIEAVLVDLYQQGERRNAIADLANETTEKKLTALFDILAVSSFVQMATLSGVQLKNFTNIANEYKINNQKEDSK